MYFNVNALQRMAGQHYSASPDAETRQVSPEHPELGSGHVLLQPGQIIRIAYVGSGRLHFHSHEWSGCAVIANLSGCNQINLRHSHPQEAWLSFDGADYLTELTIINISQGEPSGEIWLRGVDFDNEQPWLPEAMPISPTADLARGHAGSFLVPHHDAMIGMTIKNTGCWAPKDLEFFKTIINSGDTVIDVGANLGHHSVFFSKLVGDTGRVLIFEPQKSIYNYACGNIAINNCRNVDTFNGALGDSTSVMHMTDISYDQDNNFGAQSISFDSLSTIGEEVRVWKLDEMLSNGIIHIDRIDFIKIDVQSFELYVIKGALAAISRFKPKIFLEISPHWMKIRGYEYTEIYDLLRNLGYDFYHFNDGAGIDGDVRRWSGDSTEEWDICCFPIIENSE